LSDGARYDYELGLSNEMKFHGNTMTYPEIFCRTAGLEEMFIEIAGGER